MRKRLQRKNYDKDGTKAEVNKDKGQKTNAEANEDQCAVWQLPDKNQTSVLCYLQ